VVTAVVQTSLVGIALVVVGVPFGDGVSSVGVFCGAFDNFLRPLLIKRSTDIPLPLIVAGVVGGLIAFGVIGLFIGPVVLALAHTFLITWMSENEVAPSLRSQSLDSFDDAPPD
jgi:predicted PurR-regulated permease PerM